MVDAQVSVVTGTRGTEVRVVLTFMYHVGRSTETVAFQVYEILKIKHEFLQLF